VFDRREGDRQKKKLEGHNNIHLQQEILVYTLQGDTSTQAPRKGKY
jgi:hypothetical protein